MSGVNKIILLGRIGKPVEVKTFESGKKVGNTTLATSEVYKDKNGDKVEQTEWFNLVFPGLLADTAEKYVKKGEQLYVEGKIKTRSYEDKDGVKKFFTEVIVQNMSFIGGKKSEGQSEEPAQGPSYSQEEDSDDLPF
jgi:single-strand DNA-binding protein